jgi:hypothetical protein
MPLHIGSLEALRVARPKAVDLERINPRHPRPKRLVPTISSGDPSRSR